MRRFRVCSFIVPAMVLKTQVSWAMRWVFVEALFFPSSMPVRARTGLVTLVVLAFFHPVEWLLESCLRISALCSRLLILGPLKCSFTRGYVPGHSKLFYGPVCEMTRVCTS